MASYAAVVSLKQTIGRVLDCSRFSFVPPSQEILRRACRQLKPLKRILERLDDTSKIKSRKQVNDLDREIKEAVWKLEDSLESHLSHQILSQFENSEYHERDLLLIFSIDLHALRRDVDSFIETVKGLEKKYICALENMPQVDEDKSVDFGAIESNMVGFSDQFEDAKIDLTHEGYYNFVYSFVGMPGSGKTTLAKKIYEDPVILKCYDHRAWVTVGRKFQFNEIAQLDPNIKKITQGDDEKIGEKLKERLEGKRCFIVLDDVWDTKILDNLASSLPDVNNSLIRILLTTKYIVWFE